MGNVARGAAWTFGFAITLSIVVGATVRGRRPLLAARFSAAEFFDPVLIAPSNAPSNTTSQSARLRELSEIRTPRSNASARQTTGGSAAYDARSFGRMAEDWKDEREDREWSLNVTTFIGAAVESLHDGADGGGLNSLSVRCKSSVCRMDLGGDLGTLTDLFESSRQQQLHAMYQISFVDGGAFAVEAYMGKDRAEPADGG